MSASPSGSLKYEATSSVSVRPASILRAGIEPDGTGARLGGSTVTRTRCVALRPPGSVPVTVTVAVSGATPIMVRMLPDIDTETTAGAAVAAPYVSTSPSGSLKYGATSSVSVRPRLKFRAGIEPEGAGARLGVSTATPTRCVALRPPGSVAVTVTVAVPSATPLSVSALPDTLADTTAAFDVVAAYPSASPSGSLKYEARSSVAVRPTSMLRAGIEPEGAGARLGVCTVTETFCVALRPSRSVAVTTTAAVPSATPTMVRMLPDIDTETTVGDDVAAA